MFVCKNALLNIKRHKRKSILIVMICVIIVFFVSGLIDSIAKSEKQLADLPMAIPVKANVSNLVGNQIVGLDISEERLLKTRDDATVKDFLYSAHIAGNFASDTEDQNAYKEIEITAVNDKNAISNAKDKTFKFMPGADESLFTGEEAVCVASEAFLTQKGLALGDTVDLALYAFVYDAMTNSFHFEPLGTWSLRIAGSVTSEVFSAMDSALICPLEWLRYVHVKAGLDMHYNSAEFTVANPLELNAFKAQMDELGWMAAIKTAEQSLKGVSLRVRDETFIATAQSLKSNLASLYTFLPIILTVTAIAGYAISYLLMQSRRREIVLMRFMGGSRAAAVLIMLIEFAVLGLAGSLLGLAGYGLLIGFTSIETPPLALLFFCCFIIGIGAASIRLSGVNLITGLSKTEE